MVVATLTSRSNQAQSAAMMYTLGTSQNTLFTACRKKRCKISPAALRGKYATRDPR